MISLCRFSVSSSVNRGEQCPPRRSGEQCGHLERSLRKLSTGEIDMTDGQDSGEQSWDVWPEGQTLRVGAGASCPPARTPLGRVVLRVTVISPPVSPHSASWPGLLFPQTHAWRRVEAGPGDPEMPPERPVHPVGCSQLCLVEVNRGAQETGSEALIPGPVLPQLFPHRGPQAVTTP